MREAPPPGFEGHYAFSKRREHYFDHLLALRPTCGTMHISDLRNVARICREYKATIPALLAAYVVVK
jgi:hypothetical protein